MDHDWVWEVLWILPLSWHGYQQIFVALCHIMWQYLAVPPKFGLLYPQILAVYTQDAVP